MPPLFLTALPDPDSTQRPCSPPNLPSHTQKAPGKPQMILFIGDTEVLVTKKSNLQPPFQMTAFSSSSVTPLANNLDIRFKMN